MFPFNQPIQQTSNAKGFSPSKTKQGLVPAKLGVEPRNAKKSIRINLDMSDKEIRDAMKTHGTPIAEKVYDIIGKKTPLCWNATLATIEQNGWAADVDGLSRLLSKSYLAIRNHIRQINQALEPSGIELRINSRGTIITSDQDDEGMIRDNAIVQRAEPALRRMQKRYRMAQVLGTVDSLALPRGSAAEQLMLSWNTPKQIEGGK